jgi:hypothetical protein
MFKVGNEYKIEKLDLTEPTTVEFIYGKVVEYQAPLLRLRLDHGGERIRNMASSVVIDAEPR